MSSSVKYWNVASNVQSQVEALHKAADDAYSELESHDDPGALAEALADIGKRAGKLSTQIAANVPALRKAAKALDDVPGIS